MPSRTEHPVVGAAEESPPALRFRWPWRPYQARVLDELESHLADRRLHVVAAPGSGKTVLGLELFRRLGHAALVLSPTRTIRDQWIARLADFLPRDAPTPDGWVSTDLERPAYFTSVTYQALHVRARGRRDPATGDGDAATRPPRGAPSSTEVGRVAARLRRLGVRTLILDEAHHLTKAWWSALAALTERVPGLTLVSLTATPPYDALGREWHRYEALCGPVDEEISVPELVRSGTLCPHQDFVYAVAPGAEERRQLAEREQAVRTVTRELWESPELAAAVSRHPWLADPDPRAVLDETELATALLVFLKARARPLPDPLLRLLDARPPEVPALDRRWWDVLVRHYLFGTTWAPDAERTEHRDRLARRLRKLGLLRGRELRIREDRSVATRLSLSPAKLDACVEIHRLERALRGDGLRQVFLTDYIREGEPHRLGVWPLFLRLAASAPGARDLALVTGRMAVVHEDVVDRLPGGVAADATLDPVPDAPGHVRVTGIGTGRLVAALTHALEGGTLRVLVGTRALLGEGWDAPSVNALVLASCVGSFVSANQMRGRAIRRSADEPDKVASIWHLVAFDRSSPSGRADWENLEARFRQFVGLSEDGPVIESGLDRLALPGPDRSWPEVITAASIDRRAELPALPGRWDDAIVSGEHGRVVPVVGVRRAPRRPRVLFWNTLARLAFSSALFGLATFEWIVRVGDRLGLAESPLRLLAIAALLGGFASVPGLARSAWLWLRTLPVDGFIGQIGRTVRDALLEAGELSEAAGEAAVEVRTPAVGVRTVALGGGSFLDQSIFADAVEEVLGPVENPRYLVTRQGARGRSDFHAVPTLLGRNAERAGIFHRQWERRLGGATLVYTRSPEGRRALVGARSRAFSTAFVPAAERLDRWQ